MLHLLSSFYLLSRVGFLTIKEAWTLSSCWYNPDTIPDVVQFMHILLRFCVTFISMHIHKYEIIRLSDNVISSELIVFITDPACKYYSIRQILRALLTWEVALVWPKNNRNFPSVEGDANLTSIADNIFTCFQVLIMEDSCVCVFPHLLKKRVFGFHLLFSKFNPQHLF